MTTGVETALWVLGRGTGIVALVLLTLSVCLGITVRSRKVVAGVPRWGMTDIHKTASLTACTLIGVHVLTLLLDPQAGLRVVDLVVPFVGDYRPFWLGLGTLGLELVAVVAITGMTRKRIGERAFHAFHLLSYASWPVALGHGLGTGTDAGSSWMDALAICCALAVLSAGWWRLGEDFGSKLATSHLRTSGVPSGAPRLEHAEPLGAADLGRRVPLVGEPPRQ